MSNIVEISETGNELETLKELRRKLAETIDNCQSARDIAALSRQLQLVITRISELGSLEDNQEIAEMVNRYKDRQVR